MAVGEVRIPYGKGVALRDDLARDGRTALHFLQKIGARWAAVNIAHPTTAGFLKQNGIDVWLFALPEKFTENEWAGTLVRMERICNELGIMQILPDVEMYRLRQGTTPAVPWAHAPVSVWMALGQALLGLVQRGIAIGFTTYDSLMRKTEEYIGRVIGPLGAWAAPQVYDHELGETFARPWNIYKKWKSSTSWSEVVPFVGSLSPPHGNMIFSSFRGYFQAISMNPWRGAILWYERQPAGEFLDVVIQWTVGGAPPARSGGGGLIAGALLLLAVGTALLLSRR